MGLAVFLEDQIHRRTYCGSKAGESLERVIEGCRGGSLLANVHPYGDTMFNMIQLQQLSAELDARADCGPELEADVSTLKVIFGKAIRPEDTFGFRATDSFAES